MEPEQSRVKGLESEVDTRKHCALVARYIMLVCHELMERALNHDASKLESPQREAFANVSVKLAGLTYGSPEYQASLNELGPALADHYDKERHHPQHFPGGISDMNLIDVVEMLCDWWASSKRHTDGSIEQSIAVGQKRFGISDQLAQILYNTVESLNEKKINLAAERLPRIPE